MRYLRRAFTLVELTFVILVFGIVAAIGSEIYAKIYENYLITRSINSLQTKTEIALEQIAKRLQYRIKSSVIGVKSDLSDFITTADPRLDENYTILEWIGYDETGFRGEYNSTLNYFQPIWSGFIDVDDSNQTVISTPGSRLFSEYAKHGRQVVLAHFQQDIGLTAKGASTYYQILRHETPAAPAATKH